VGALRKDVAAEARAPDLVGRAGPWRVAGVERACRVATRSAVASRRLEGKVGLGDGGGEAISPAEASSRDFNAFVGFKGHDCFVILLSLSYSMLYIVVKRGLGRGCCRG
jgi:hypothetical protein